MESAPTTTSRADPRQLAREAIVSLVIVALISALADVTDESRLGFAAGLLVGLRVGALSIAEPYRILTGLGAMLLGAWPFIIRPYGEDAALPTLLTVAIMIGAWVVGIIVGQVIRMVRAAVRNRRIAPVERTT